MKILLALIVLGVGQICSSKLQGVVPVDMYISEADFGSTEGKASALSTAGCKGSQFCDGYDISSKTCDNGGYGMGSCHSLNRYIIDGCCSAEDWKDGNGFSYVWCCDSQIEIPEDNQKLVNCSQTAPDISFKFISSYDRIWRSYGFWATEGPTDGVAIWQPENADSEYCVLGDIATGTTINGGGTYGEWPPTKKSLGLKANKPGALVHPTSFTQIWNDKDGNAEKDGAVWQMNAPAGYTCLGSVAMGSHTKTPDSKKYCCVKDEYVVSGKNEKVYDNKDEGLMNDIIDIFGKAKPVSFWTIEKGSDATGIAEGNFIAVKGSDKPSSGHLLKMDGKSVRSIYTEAQLIQYMQTA